MSRTVPQAFGVATAIVGVKVATLTSLHWWGLVGGAVCIGLGWGVYSEAGKKGNYENAERR